MNPTSASWTRPLRRALLALAAASAASAHAAPPDFGTLLEGLQCTGPIQLPNGEGTDQITLAFGEPDLQGPQGRYRLAQRSNTRGDFYDCAQKGEFLRCTYDAGRASGPLNLKVLRNGGEIHGVFNSPFAEGVPMAFQARCRRPE